MGAVIPSFAGAVAHLESLDGDFGIVTPFPERVRAFDEYLERHFRDSTKSSNVRI